MMPGRLFGLFALILASALSACATTVPSEEGERRFLPAVHTQIVPVWTGPGWQLCTTGCDLAVTPKTPIVARASALPDPAALENAEPAGQFEVVSEYTVVSAHFAMGSAVLRDPGSLEQIVTPIRALLESSRNIEIDVLGYTDATGPASVNARLAQARADTVAARLRAGLPADRVTVQAVGHPQCCYIADNASAGGRAQNRRVTVTVRAEGAGA